MARSNSLLTWKRIFVIGFVSLCILLYGNEFIFWKQTTIYITSPSATNYNPNQNEDNKLNNTNPINTNSNTNITIQPMNEIALLIQSTKMEIKNESKVDNVVYLYEPNQNIMQRQKDFNLYESPYEDIPRSQFLSFIKSKYFSSFGECIESIDDDNNYGQCLLSKYILFKIIDIIGSGNHGKILSCNIDIGQYLRHYDMYIPLGINRNYLRNGEWAVKYSNNNETCQTLQFEYNIMRKIQSSDNMNNYFMTDLHPLIPWIDWYETNKFTQVTERKCILIMQEIKNVKTLQGVIQKNFPPSFEYDHGLIPFVINCYNDLMIAMDRLHTFNYYHIDINGVNILVWPRYNITTERVCYLIDYGGVFAMNYDAKTDKLFTGKSHNYSPFAYYNLYIYQLRRKSNWNLPLLNYYGKKDNQYRIICELLYLYLEYVTLEKDVSFTETEWKYIENAQLKQDEILHVKPVGINPSNQTYIQYIWCLRQIQIDNIRKSNLGTKLNIYKQSQKDQLYKLLDILEKGTVETNAINYSLCTDIIQKGIAKY